jgi:hypothetical protein
VRIPAKSTIHAVLHRHGLVKGLRRPRPRASGTDLSAGVAPNELWCADFKGEFKLGNGHYCYPLTVTDHASRFLLLCEALESTREDTAITAFEQLFLERGLPAIRYISDPHWDFPTRTPQPASNRLSLNHRGVFAAGSTLSVRICVIAAACGGPFDRFLAPLPSASDPPGIVRVATCNPNRPDHNAGIGRGSLLASAALGVSAPDRRGPCRRRRVPAILTAVAR